MDYQIIATLGPSCDMETTWQAMLAAGVTAFRLNTSHLTMSQLQTWLDRLSVFLADRNPRVPLILDLQGSKWRLGEFPACELFEGERVVLVCSGSADRHGVLPVPRPDFFRAAPASASEIILNDAKLRLVLESRDENRLSARVAAGGTVSPRKGITYAASTYRQESLTESDRTILAHTRHHPQIRYALSYVKDAAEMANYRAHVGESAFLIAKLERRSAVDEARQIAETANELWLCRGDLGAELGVKAMAASVHGFSRCAAAMPVPVLLAGQIFEHMTEHPTPTRSEVCALYDALMNGYRGVVLSDETAIGRNPVEGCRMAAMFRDC